MSITTEADVEAALRSRNQTVRHLDSTGKFAATSLRLLATDAPDMATGFLGCWCGRHPAANRHDAACFAARCFFELWFKRERGEA